MSKIKTLFFISVLISLFSFLSCEYNPNTMQVKSAEELCDYMNQNCQGDFTIVKSESVNETKRKGTVVYLASTALPGSNVIVKYIWEQQKLLAPWNKRFETNYFAIKHQQQEYDRIDKQVKNRFSAFKDNIQIKTVRTVMPENTFTITDPTFEDFIVYINDDQTPKNYAFAVKTVINGKDVTNDAELKINSLIMERRIKENETSRKLYENYVFYLVNDSDYDLETLNYETVITNSCLQDFKRILFI